MMIDVQVTRFLRPSEGGFNTLNLRKLFFVLLLIVWFDCRDIFKPYSFLMGISVSAEEYY